MNTQISNALQALYVASTRKDSALIKDCAQRLADVVALCVYRVKAFSDLEEAFRSGWHVDLSEDSFVLMRQSDIIECWYEGAKVYVHAHSADVTVYSPLVESPSGGMATVHILKDGVQINAPAQYVPTIGVEVDVTSSGALIVTWPDRTDIYGPGKWDIVTHLRNIEGW